jgi:hypothetical protein
VILNKRQVFSNYAAPFGSIQKELNYWIIDSELVPSSARIAHFYATGVATVITFRTLA